MKIKPNLLAIINIIFFTATILLGIAACDPHKTNKDINQDTSLAESHNDTRFDDTSKANDATFMEETAIFNLHEIGLGDIANNKSKTPEILVLSKMLVEHHTISSNDLKLMADSKNISLPLSVENNPDEAIDKLVKESKSTFDKSFLELVINKHKEAISKFESASKSTKDVEIKDYIALAIPTLKQHLMKAEDILIKIK